MVAQLSLPPTDLRGDVECGVVVQRPAGSSSRFPAMPRAMLTVTFAPTRTATVSFYALSTRAASHTHTEPVSALGLVLPPHTAARLLGMSTGAQVDCVLPWAEIAGTAEAERLGDALQVAIGDPARLVALQVSLQRVLAYGSARRQRARAESLLRLCSVVGHQGTRAATALGLGERQLERRCRALLGMTPKQMQRISRWHRLLTGALRGRHTPALDAALAAGYYDQSHLARECRLLTGTTLRELLQQADADGAWWALRTALMLT